MAKRQYCTPHIVSAGKAIALPRISFDDRALRESWYQKLLFDNPLLIPVDEIEPAFGPLIPLARELRTGKGPVDIAYINPDGYITLVETKLWKSPEARRDVVAQIIEYATGMAKLTYADLCDEVHRARRGMLGESEAGPLIERDADPILPLVQGELEFDEARFVDAVTRNLRLGRFLLLIVGDGIQEGVEELAEAMQESPHLGFTLALVETAVYRLNGEGGDLLVQPRVLARTREIVRHVIEIRNEHSSAIVSVKAPAVTGTGQGSRSQGITETAFFEQLEKSTGKPTADFARWFVAEVARTPQLRLTWSKEGPLLRWDDDAGDRQASLLRLQHSGELSGTNGIASFCARHALPMVIADDFQDRLCGLLPEAKRVERGLEGYTHLMASGGGSPSFAALANHRDAFWKLISETTASLAKAITAQQGQPAD